MIIQIARFVIMIIFTLIPNSRLFVFKNFLLNLVGHQISLSARINSSVKIYGHGILKIGHDTWVGPNVSIYLNDTYVEIGDNCDIAPSVNIVTGTHKINNDINIFRIAGDGYSEPIKIGSGSWVCFGALILHGSVVPARTIVKPYEVVRRC